MPILLADVLRIEDTATDVSGLLRAKQLGMANDNKHQMIYKTENSGYYNFSPDETFTGTTNIVTVGNLGTENFVPKFATNGFNNSPISIDNSTVKIMGSSTGYVGLKGQTTAGSITYTLPNSDGTNDQTLTTDGSGNLFWSTKVGTLSGTITSLNGDNSASQTINAAGLIGITNAGSTHTVTFTHNITAGYLPYSTSSTAFGTSVAYNTASGIGISNTNPKALIHLLSTTHATPTTDYSNIFAGGLTFMFRDNYDGYIANNLYYGSDSNWKYKKTQAGFMINLSEIFNINSAVSGTAENSATLVNRFHITTTGKIGINNSNPIYNLHSKETGTDNNWVCIEHTNSNKLAGLYAQANTSNQWVELFACGSTASDAYCGITKSSVLLFGSDYAGIVTTNFNVPLVFGTNNTERARLHTNGYFGVGTTDPQTRIHAAGSIRAAGGDVYSYDATGRGTFIGCCKSQGSLPGYSSDYYPVLKTDFSDLYIAVNNKYVGSFVGGASTNGLSLMDPTPSEKIWLCTAGNSFFNGGNLAIGTNGNSDWKLYVSNTTTGSSYSNMLVLTNGTDNDIEFTINNVGAATKYSEIKSYSTVPLILNTTTGGNVGIGILAPLHKLDVNGNISLCGGGTSSTGVLVISEASDGTIYSYVGYGKQASNNYNIDIFASRNVTIYGGSPSATGGASSLLGTFGDFTTTPGLNFPSTKGISFNTEATKIYSPSSNALNMQATGNITINSYGNNSVGDNAKIELIAGGSSTTAGIVNLYSNVVVKKTLTLETVQTVTMVENTNVTPTCSTIELGGDYNATLQSGDLPVGTIVSITNIDGTTPTVTSWYQSDSIHNCGIFVRKASNGNWYRLSI